MNTWPLLRLLSPALLILISGCFHAGEGNTDRSSQSRPLNDTGVTVYIEEIDNGNGTYSYTLSNNVSAGLPGTDASHGRDVQYPDASDGEGGFNYTKLDSNGQALTDQATDYALTPWRCVKDNTTGLIWEVKTSADLQDARNRYTWYNEDTNSNGGHAGYVGDSSSCYSTLSSCDTAQYINAINSLNSVGLCGFKDWRLPTREELRSILHYGKPTGSAMIDTNYFPNTEATDHWTSQTAVYATEDASMAWEVHFEAGFSEAHSKGSKHVAVRLVRGPQ